MKILIVNPNTTQSMTDKIAEAARSVAATDTEILAINPQDGPASVEGYYDEAFAVPGLLREIRKGELMGVDGYIVACFDDPGLHAVRSIATGPAVGICEAAVYAASMVAGSFTVVTTLRSSVPAIEKVVRGYGRDHFCRRVRAAEIPVLDLEKEGSEARLLIEAEIERAVNEDSAEAIILGCAGMADLTRQLTEKFGLPVIDGVATAVKMVEGLITLGLQTSKVGGYVWPPMKSYIGEFVDDEPVSVPS
ncbi:MAG: aspartate/glutamate racemase family protein [Pseudomonadales bacterium]|nr:aspartate/glutamate racemase family protein [Pseudomonadales bacterium]